jgi:hypothetical protein
LAEAVRVVTYGVPVNGILCDVESSSAGNTDNTRDNTSDDGNGDGVDNTLAELGGLHSLIVDVRPGRDGSGSAGEESGGELELHCVDGGLVIQ